MASNWQAHAAVIVLCTMSTSYVGGQGGRKTKRLYKAFSLLVTQVVRENRPFGTQQDIISECLMDLVEVEKTTNFLHNGGRR